MIYDPASSARNTDAAKDSATAATMTASSNPPSDTKVRSMGRMLPHARKPIEYQRGPTVDDRLAVMLGVKTNTAHQLLYGETGIRARAILIVRAFRMCGRNPLEYFAPLLAALDGSTDASVTRKVEADARENICMAAFLTDDDGDKSDTRRDLILSLEKEAAEALALAGQLRVEQEAERE